MYYKDSNTMQYVQGAHSRSEKCKQYIARVRNKKN